jgi:hypothetical protein
MDLNDMIILAILIAFFLVGLYSVWTGFKNFLLAQKIKNTAVSKAGSVAVGLVGISGRALSDAPEPSPINGILSVYWKITGEYYFYSGRSGHWLPFYSAESGKKRFSIVDETGRIRIDPTGATMDLTVDRYEGTIAERRVFMVNLPPTMDGQVMKYINSLDDDTQAPFREHDQSQIRIFEYYIADNGPVYVMGSAEPVTLAPGTGTGDTLEIRKGTTDKILYITTSGEQQVIKKTSSWCPLNIFGGIFLCVAAAYGFYILPGLSEWDAESFALILMIVAIAAWGIYTIVKKVWDDAG